MPVEREADSGGQDLSAPDAPVPARPRRPLTGAPSFGTAVGATMLGLEQALRSQPPPEVVAAEHRPIRGLSAAGDDMSIVFPDET